MQREEFLKSYPDFHPGVSAYSADGEDLGEVQKLDKDKLIIEKGRFFAEDHPVDYEQVADVRNDRVVLSLNRENLGAQGPGGAPPREDWSPAVPEIETTTPVSQEGSEPQKHHRRNSGPLT